MTVQFSAISPAPATGRDAPAAATTTRVTVLGLGYVGLPLAVALARKYFVTGFDIDTARIAELSEGHDRTREIDAERLAMSTLGLTSDAAVCPPSDFYIVTVPTPIDAHNRPDLRLVEAASRTVGAMLPDAVAEGRQPVVVYESTVYPGVTEDICGPILEAVSGLKCGEDFFLGYSPERINPGDREHTIDRITKVVSGQTPQVLDRVADLYGAITSGGVFRAASIKAAEAAKVIENAQRDINIAFMNEIAMIFGKIGVAGGNSDLATLIRTAVITIMLAGSTYAPPIKGVTLGHHDLSHHGKDPGKLEQLKIVEVETMKTVRDLLAKLKQSKEDGSNLLDRTTVFLGSNLGDGSSHSTQNLPVLLAGGGFKHGQHLHFDPKNPPPLCNLFVNMLQGLGIATGGHGDANRGPWHRLDERV